MFQTVDINIVPTGEMPVVNVSQYDVNRIIRFCLLNDGETYTPTNFLKAEFIIRKVDGTLFTQETTILVSNVLELVTTEQMTACAGKNIGEIRLTFNDPDIAEDDVIISTLNFILEVERSPETGGIESESEIANLDGQIAAIVDEQLDNYYTKSEIDDQIETIVTEQVTPIVSGIVAEQVPPAVQAELGNYYTKDETDTYFYNKTETDTLLSGKADVSSLPDMTTYYTKTETDTLLSGKVSNSTLNDYYTKTQVDTLISGVGVDITTYINTPAAVQTFTDGGKQLPLKECNILINAQQAGSGTPSPSNPRTITGFSTVDVSVSDGVNPATVTTVVLGSTIWGGSVEAVNGTLIKTHEEITIGDCTWAYSNSTGTFYTDTVTDEAKILGEVTVMCEQYNAIANVSSGSSIADDLSICMYAGNVASTHRIFVKDTSFAGDYEAFKTAMSSVKIVYELAVPVISTITGVNINTTINGTNNISADSGNITRIEYFNNKADDIAALLTLIERG